MKQEYVYEFLYNPSIYESAAQTVSIHKTRRGAEKAMELHKEMALIEYEEVCNRLPDEKDFPFGYDQWWGVRESILMP